MLFLCNIMLYFHSIYSLYIFLKFFMIFHVNHLFMEILHSVNFKVLVGALLI